MTYLKDVSSLDIKVTVCLLCQTIAAAPLVFIFMVHSMMLSPFQKWGSWSVLRRPYKHTVRCSSLLVAREAIHLPDYTVSQPRRRYRILADMRPWNLVNCLVVQASEKVRSTVIG
jgi:hypothetical protein